MTLAVRVYDARFFTDALGLVLTDRSKMMAFVRTNDDYHWIAIADAAVSTLNHIAFQMPTLESVMRAAGRMVDHRFPIGWGPGGARTGRQPVHLFRRPVFGFVIEYTAEVL